MFRDEHTAYLPTVQATISFFQLRRYNRLADLEIDQKGNIWNNYVALNQKKKKREKNEQHVLLPWTTHDFISPGLHNIELWLVECKIK